MLNAKELKEFLEEMEKDRELDLEKISVFVYAENEGYLEEAEEVEYDGESVNIWA